MPQEWIGTIAIEGEPTGDGRMIARGALRWEDGPWALILDLEEGDHSGRTVGAMTRIWREDDLIMAEGYLSESDDPETQAAVNRAAELLDEGAVGVSVMLDDEDIEIRVSVEAMEQREVVDADELPDADADGRIVVARWAADDELMVTTDARIRHLAIVDTSAFVDARINLVASIALVASLDLDAFANPQFGTDGDSDPRLVRQEPERSGEQATWGAPLQVDEDGRVFGHAALWGRCHAGFADRCVIPPRDGSYSRFLHGGAIPGVATGPLTVGTDHATLSASATEAMRHYSDTGRAVADVTVGEDAHGIWVAGRLRPGVSEADVAALRGSSLSGDWRPVAGRLRLAGLLAVNNPGFLVQRTSEALAAAITAGPCDCDPLVAANGDFSGAVVALLPSQEDAERLAQDSGEPADALHVTVVWMGPADDIDAETRDAVMQRAAAFAAAFEPVTAEAFATAVFNPAGDEDASVLLIQHPDLPDVREAFADLDASEHPVWFPHLTLAYGQPDLDLSGLVGEVTFDRVMVAFADDATILPLGAEPEAVAAAVSPLQRALVSVEMRRLLAGVA